MVFYNKMKKILTKQQIGKKARQSGAVFERRVRDDLENKGWIVCKWQNQIDLEKNKIVPAKHKFNPFTRNMTVGHGLPDYICIRWKND